MPNARAADSPLLLVLRALGLGDLLTGIPALRALRAGHPESRLLLAAPAWLAPLAGLSGAVDEVVDVAPLGPVPVTAPQLAVNLHGRGPQSTARLRDTRPGRLVAFDLPGGPGWRDNEHEVVRWCRLVRDGLGLDADPAALGLPPPAVPPPVPGATVVHPFSAAPARCWPLERFVALAAALAARGEHVVLTGSSAQRPQALVVAAAAGLPDDAVLAGRTDLLSLAALVGAARRVVCADTGVGHLATAYGVPSVVLFGPVGPHLWGPPPGQSRHVALWPGPASDPAAPVPAPALLAIGVGDVLAALDGTAPPPAVGSGGG